MTKQKPQIYLILANLCWAGNYIFGKYVVQEMTPVQMTFFRWLIAISFLFPLAHLMEKPDWKSILSHWKILLLSSLSGIIAYNFFLYEALRYTTSLNASLINAMNPILIAICATWFLNEKMTYKRMIGFIISFCGVLFILTKGNLSIILNQHFNLGDVMMLGAISVWTLYSIIGKKIKTIPPISATAISALFGVICLFPFVLLSKSPFTITSLSSHALIGIIYIGIFPSVVAFICWNKGIRELDVGQSGIYMSLITLFTAFISLALGNPINLYQIIGGILIFTGILITSNVK